MTGTSVEDLTSLPSSNSEDAVSPRGTPNAGATPAGSYSHTEIEAARERMALNARRCGIPEYMIDGLIRYVLDRVPPGSFLMAVLENNLMRALECADETNSRCLKAYAMFLYNYVPMSCKGSPEKVEAWLSRKPDDAELGMAWWNNLPEHSRAAWLREAKSDVPADAWAAYKATISDDEGKSHD